MYPIPSSLTSSLSNGSDDNMVAYLDIVNDTAGYNHIALFAPASSDKPIFLTSGNWEVTGGILGVDTTRRLVYATVYSNNLYPTYICVCRYFQAASPSSIERNIFSVELPSSLNSIDDFKPEIIALTDISQHNYYNADFSPEAGFYMLSYKGPNVPWQSIFKTGDEGPCHFFDGILRVAQFSLTFRFDLTDFVYTITENSKLNATLLEFQAPIISWSTIQSDGYGKSWLTVLYDVL